MSGTFSPPEGCNRNAEHWYYTDNVGTLQGPFTFVQMREWFEAGFLPPETCVAGSYYGEVPETLWPIQEVKPPRATSPRTRGGSEG